MRAIERRTSFDEPFKHAPIASITVFSALDWLIKLDQLRKLQFRRLKKFMIRLERRKIDLLASMGNGVINLAGI